MSPDVYEVGVTAADDEFDHCYYVEHRFSYLPEIDTLADLKREATGAFDVLYPEEEIEQIRVSVTYLSAQEREGPEQPQPVAAP